MADPRSEQRLLAALARSVDTVVVADGEGRIGAASPSIAEVLGHDPDDLLGRPVLELVHPDDRVLAGDAWTATLGRPGRHRPLDIRVLTSTGSALAMRAIAVNCLDDPVVAGVVVTLRDCSGMEAYELSVASRNDHYRQIVELAAEGVWVTDADLVTTFVSERMARMLGYKPHEMIGRRSLEFTDVTGAEIDERLARRAAGVSELTSFPWRHRDGRTVRTSVATTPIHGPDGEFLGAIGMLSDVTELEAERARLAADDARHNALMDALPDLVFRFDEHGTYLEHHAGREDDLLAPPEEFLGRRLRDLLPPRVAETTESAIHRALSTGSVVQYEYDLDLPNGPATFEARISPMPGREVVALIRNVTELRAAETARRDLVAEVEQRRADEQIRKGLERHTRLEALGRLAGGVAHDINNLLGVIGNYAAAIQRSTPDPVTAQDAREIVTAVGRGSALTRRLLMFGRRDQRVAEEHDLVGVVRDLAGLLRRSLEDSHPLVLDLADEPCPVRIDPDQVGQAVLNLVVNAADAAPPGTPVTVSVRRAGPVAGDRAGVELAVVDHGPGMSQDVRDHAFEPFFTTKEELGTGLGLSIVHGVASDSGGTVELACPPEGGTVARMWLPLVGGGVPAAAPDEPAAVRVLLVDDDRDALRSAARLLRTAGFEVDVATSGAEALAKVRTRGIDVDVVLADVVMPGTSGPALAVAMRSERPGVPVVLMTGHHGELQIGADVVVIEKPLDVERVREALQHATGVAQLQ